MLSSYILVSVFTSVLGALQPRNQFEVDHVVGAIRGTRRTWLYPE